MRLQDDPEMAKWLEKFTGDFNWDSGNRTKNRKHQVESQDVESLFWRPAVLAGRITEPAHEEQRWLLLGVAQDGRELALVFCRREDKLRPISCRRMRKKEREFFWEVLGNDET